MRSRLDQAVNLLQYSRSMFWICSFISLAVAGCAVSQNTALASTLEPLLVETEATPSLPATSNQIADASVPVSGEEALWTKLMEADEETYVVLLRHAIIPSTGDPADFQLGDCSTQRNLSDAGRQQAMEIGAAFRDRNIPVSEVLSSQWCRCLETAELMDIAPVEPFPPLNSFFRDRSTAESQTTQVKEYIAANEGSSGVIVMVTHQVNITALNDIFPHLGSAVVFQLDVLSTIES